MERRHSHAASGLGGRVCVVVGDEDANRSFLSFFKNACVKKIRRIWWICHDGSWTFRTRAAEVSLTAVRGGFDRFLMTPWNVGQNPSCYKKRARLARAAN